MNPGVRRSILDRCFTGLINVRGQRMSMQYHKERITYFLVEDLPHTDLKLHIFTNHNQSKVFHVNTDTLGHFSTSINIESIDIPTRIEYVDVKGKLVSAPIIPIQGYG